MTETYNKNFNILRIKNNNKKLLVTQNKIQSFFRNLSISLK